MGNIEIAYTISGRKEPMDRQYLDHLSDLLSIKGRLQHRPSELSGGEQQRVAIARALITRPAIVLADEPTGNLDTQNSNAVLDMLLRSNRELGQTTLMITHNPEAAAIAGRILYMRDGQIVREEKGGAMPRFRRLPAMGYPLPQAQFDPISAARYTQGCSEAFSGPARDKGILRPSALPASTASRPVRNDDFLKAQAGVAQW